MSAPEPKRRRRFADQVREGVSLLFEPRRWVEIPEAWVLRTGFRLLLAASAVVIALDLRTILEEADARLPGDPSRAAPVIMDPPRQSDQIRRYLPLTAPIDSPDARPELPGVGTPDDDALAEEMRFVRGPDGAASLFGRIELGTAAAFLDFLEAQGDEIRVVHLHSPGGSVQDAIAMAEEIRRREIDTVAPDRGYCASSCPLVFSGGVRRTVGVGAWVGVHRVFAAGDDGGTLAEGIARGQEVSAAVQSHLQAMGVDPALWIRAMETPSESLYLLTPEELLAFSLATDLRE